VLFLIIAACNLTKHVAQGLDKNPCQKDSNKQRSSSCQKITIPAGLCQVCGVNAPITSTGEYLDCKRTSGLENAAMQTNQQCLSLMQNYVAKNPCDTARSTALNLYKSTTSATNRETGRQRLDYFLYSICENGCDCIPQINARPWELSVDVHRGNCQAHAYYDICTVLPQIKLIRGEGTADDNVTALPAVCPLISNWFLTSGDGLDFLQKPFTPVVPAVEYFFNRLIEAEELLIGTANSNALWQECLFLETSQGRINTTLTKPTPSGMPSHAPTQVPSKMPSSSPLKMPSSSPSKMPSSLLSSSPSTLPVAFPLRMSVGETDPGFSFTDASGAVWGYDRYYGSTGASSNVFVGVVKTVDDILFQKQRFGNNLQYSIAPVQPGKYKVTLYMAEMTFLFAGVRVFDIFMEGVLIRDNLDMFALAGRRRSAIFLEQIVNVTDGTLDISFVSVIGIPTVAAIKVERFVQ
jgi:hypothetical protein